MISVYSLLFTLVLFSELNSHSVTVAMPAAKVEDGVSEAEGLTSILGEESLTEPAVVPPSYRRNLVLDGNTRDEDKSPKIIIISDMRLKGHSGRGLNPALTQNFPLLSDRSFSFTPPEHSLKVERRENNLDVLRCMIGRVYRPCWEL